jgi:hypothetical protein
MIDGDHASAHEPRRGDRKVVARGQQIEAGPLRVRADLHKLGRGKLLMGQHESNESALQRRWLGQLGTVLGVALLCAAGNARRTACNASPRKCGA